MAICGNVANDDASKDIYKLARYTNLDTHTQVIYIY